MAIQQQMNSNDFSLNRPETLAGHLSYNAIQWRTSTMYERNQCLHSVTFADFQEFCRNFGTEMRIKALIQGNVIESHALSVMNKMLDELNFKKIGDVSILILLIGFSQLSIYCSCIFLAVFCPIESAQITNWIELFAMQKPQRTGFELIDFKCLSNWTIFIWNSSVALSVENGRGWATL